MTTQNMLIGGALIASAAALAVSVYMLLGPRAPDDDQPVTMVGGSLRMFSTDRWRYNSRTKDYTYKSAHAVDRVEWSCNTNSEDSTTAKRTGALDIKVHYGSATPHVIQLNTDQNGKNLMVKTLSGSTTAPGHLRRLMEGGEHPVALDVTKVEITGVDTPIDNKNCPDPKQILLTITVCQGNGCL